MPNGIAPDLSAQMSVLSLAAEDIVSPRRFHDTNQFLEDLTIDAILLVVPLREVGRGRLGTGDGSVILKPACLITAGETDG
jgi:hypothetical protein